MLTMIIADDEFIVRDGLSNSVNWEELGVKVIAEAVDGQEALELCQELKPDILLTDIRMPLVDGLEVAMKLKEWESDIRVIIISGIQDFNYAKTALDIHVEGYILKPVRINVLVEMVTKVVHRIKMERNLHSEMTHLKQQLHEHFPLIREKFLRNLIWGVSSTEKEIHAKLSFYQLPLRAEESHLVSVLQIDDYDTITENKSEEDKQILSFSVSNIVEEIISSTHSGVSFCANENEFVLIFNSNMEGTNRHTEICEEILACLRKYLKISISIGIGRPVNNILAIHSSYKDACMALKYKFHTGKNSILHISDIYSINDISANTVDRSNFYDKENLLMNAIKLGDSSGVSNILRSMFDQLRNMPVDYIQSICLEMVCIASRTAQDLSEDLDHIVGKRSSIFESIYKKENAQDLNNYISNLFNLMAQYFSNKYNQKNTKVIQKMMDIIKLRYKEDISVMKISEEIYLTPNYISLIFKQETGVTITEYITSLRMEDAKNLLKSTNLKILEIAEKVGYENPHYFSTVFKKYTGIHPQKYRS
ncbi:hypothetical protein A8709_12965 [Paenibacillus pectinilyticus]|uniref:DNA-binding response regulator n=1 Tax=Paenibacillus pectinilyticus TaxID=512399 RepID=A0A1C1A394_9BACL|nr:response regulator [Paenibacillus pectinilyticus]OCT15025.1 hypothetical protein A8709_12965 [Paenibacillus pectinilyticus]